MIRAAKSVAGSRHFWIVVGAFVLAAVLLYPQQLPIVGADAPRSLLGTERHAAERLLFLLPIAYAGLVFGIRGGIAAVALALVLMMPRDIWISEYPVDAALETGTVVLTGVLANVMFETYRRDKVERERMLSRLQAAQEQLRTNLEEQRLTAEALRASENAYRELFEDEKRLKENLGFYLREATRAQEEERKRIARELHDETAQELVALSRELDKLAIRLGRRNEGSGAAIRELQDSVGKVLDGVRHFSQDLRPSVLDDLGLLPALQWLAGDVEKRFGIEVRTSVTGDERRLPPDAELLLFRIAQEALCNVWRHANASRAWLVVQFEDGAIKLSVRDNGTGFEVPERAGDLAEQGKLGLAGMYERARLLGATLNLESRPGEGTTVSVEMPVRGHELADA
jgi:two-component system sensor histidine kinase DegS